MDHQAAVDAIVQIEQSVDVNATTYKTIPVWILLRLILWQQLLKPSDLRQARSTPSHLQTPKKAKRRFNPIVSAPELPTAELLFFSRVEDYADQINGAFYNRHIDPMIELVRDRQSYLKLELQSRHYDQTLPRVESTHMIRSQDYTAPKFDPDQLHALVPVQTCIQAKTGIKIPTNYVQSQLEKLELFMTCFRQILPLIRPQVVFLVCYYALPALALTQVCRELGIVVVDVQHGKQGIYHGLYTHWTRIPPQGYSLLPDFFWTWGKASQQAIAQWQHNTPHQPIVGGNRWLALWRDNPQRETISVPQISPEIRRRILVSLQPIDPPIPSHLLEAMARSPSDWIWLLRLHPHQTQHRDVIQSILDQHGITQAILHTAVEYPLYALLQQVDHHLTGWSSVGYEALAFGVPTTILHPSGWQLYHQDIEQGYFTYADTAEAVLAQIQTPIAPNTAQSPYIETDRSQANHALDIILHHARSRLNSSS